MDKATAKFEAPAHMGDTSAGEEAREQKGLELISATPPQITHEMDRLSLHQALMDFEIANLRAMDLTQRLMETARENRELKAGVQPLADERERLRSKNEQLQAELDSVRKHYDELLATKAYKVIKLIWALRRVLRV